MTQTIIDNGAYSLRVTVKPIKALPGQFNIRAESQYKGAKNPDVWREVFQVTCDQRGLEAFGRDIYEAATEK